MLLQVATARWAARSNGAAPRTITCAASPQPDVKDAPSDGALISVVLKLKREIAQLKDENARLRAVVKSNEGAKAAQSSTSAAAAGEATAGADGETKEPASDSAAEHTGVYTVEQLEKAVRWPTKGQRFWQDPPRDPKVVLEDASPPGRAVIQRDAAPMHVVHIAPELAPCAKVGGLGDVVQGLAKASMQRGHTVEVSARCCSLQSCSAAATPRARTPALQRPHTCIATRTRLVPVDRRKPGPTHGFTCSG